MRIYLTTSGGCVYLCPQWGRQKCLSACLQSWVLSPLKAKSTQPHQAVLGKSEGKGEGTDEAMSDKS